jgi:hypothetical protein
MNGVFENKAMTLTRSRLGHRCRVFGSTPILPP